MEPSAKQIRKIIEKSTLRDIVFRKCEYLLSIKNQIDTKTECYDNLCVCTCLNKSKKKKNCICHCHEQHQCMDRYIYKNIICDKLFNKYSLGCYKSFCGSQFIERRLDCNYDSYIKFIINIKFIPKHLIQELLDNSHNIDRHNHNKLSYIIYNYLPTQLYYLNIEEYVENKYQGPDYERGVDLNYAAEGYEQQYTDYLIELHGKGVYREYINYNIHSKKNYTFQQYLTKKIGIKF